MRSFLFTAAAALVATAAAADSSELCNGHKELCGKKFSDVTFVGSHNTPFTGGGPAANQHKEAKEQLDLGVRYLQAQTQVHDGGIRMCHTSCDLLDAGPMDEYLGSIADWMAEHPREVVTLLLTNIDSGKIEEFKEAFETAGLDKLAFVPAQDKLALDKWPTLGELIDKKTRVVVFLDSGADTKKVPYILPHWDYFWETPYGETDPAFPTCEVHRPNNGNPEVSMSLINHVLNQKLLPSFLSFLQGDSEEMVVPAMSEAKTTNSEKSLMSQVDLCRGQWGRNPNVILLDWIDVGDAIKVQNQLNGVA